MIVLCDSVMAKCLKNMQTMVKMHKRVNYEQIVKKLPKWRVYWGNAEKRS